MKDYKMKVGDRFVHPHSRMKFTVKNIYHSFDQFLPHYIIYKSDDKKEYTFVTFSNDYRVLNFKRLKIVKKVFLTNDDSQLFKLKNGMTAFKLDNINDDLFSMFLRFDNHNHNFSYTVNKHGVPIATEIFSSQELIDKGLQVVEKVSG